jgi:hypothetical protein
MGLSQPPSCDTVPSKEMHVYLHTKLYFLFKHYNNSELGFGAFSNNTKDIRYVV